jgi:hypothetical protein
MAIKLSAEQEAALQDGEQNPLRVWDAAGRSCYVLVPAEAYQRLEPLFEADDFDVREFYPLADEVFGPAGWDDPKMDEYNDYDAHREAP